MRLRAVLVALMLTATITFVAGVAVERNHDDHHPAAVEAAEHHDEATAHDEAGSSPHCTQPAPRSPHCSREGVATPTWQAPEPALRCGAVPRFA
jgi:hypothetical protein